MIKSLFEKYFYLFCIIINGKYNRFSPTNKLCLYSVHDTTLVCLMVSLGLEVEKWVDFAADLALELYKNKVRLSKFY